MTYLHNLYETPGCVVFAYPKYSTKSVKTHHKKWSKMSLKSYKKRVILLKKKEKKRYLYAILNKLPKIKKNRVAIP